MHACMGKLQVNHLAMHVHILIYSMTGLKENIQYPCTQSGLHKTNYDDIYVRAGVISVYM